MEWSSTFVQAQATLGPPFIITPLLQYGSNEPQINQTTFCRLLTQKREAGFILERAVVNVHNQNFLKCDLKNINKTEKNRYLGDEK